jgi:uncharacterized membrane protein
MESAVFLIVMLALAFVAAQVIVAFAAIASLQKIKRLEDKMQILETGLKTLLFKIIARQNEPPPAPKEPVSSASPPKAEKAPAPEPEKKSAPVDIQPPPVHEPVFTAQPAVPPPKPDEKAAAFAAGILSSRTAPPPPPPPPPKTDSAFGGAENLRESWKEASEREKSEFEKNAESALRKIWRWIIVGDEFRRKGVSAEYAVASEWLLRAAIVIILFGAVFFLKWSVDHGILGPLGRVAISIFAGLGLLGWGMRIHAGKYGPIGLGLIGAGLATLYFSVFASFAMHKLVPQIPAFCFMCMITLAACLLSVRLNSLLAALIGVAGGYCTPILLSTGTANLPGLYGYLLLLGAGVLWISWKKDWKILYIISFAMTYFIALGAAQKFYRPGKDFPVFMLFNAAWFVLFAFAPLLHNLKNGLKTSALEMFVIFANSVCFFGSSFLIMKFREKMASEYCGALSLCVAAFYAGQLWFFIHKKAQDRNLMFIFIGFASFFTALAAPLLLSGEWLGFAWSAQALVFLWISVKTSSHFLKKISYVLYALALGKILLFDAGPNFLRMESASAYFSGLGHRAVTLGAFIASLFGAAWLAKRNPDFFDRADSFGARPAPAVKVIAVFGALLLFVYLHFEFYHCAEAFYPPLTPALLSFIWVAAVVILSRAASKNPLQEPLWGIMTAAALLLSLKIIFFDSGRLHASPFGLCFASGYTMENLLARTLDFIPVIAAFGYAARVSLIKGRADHTRLFVSLAAGFLLMWVTFETKSFFNCFNPDFGPGAVSIAWGVFALAALLIGIRKSVKALRYAALTLFAVTVLKVFFVDMAAMETQYKIIAFIILGFVILGASFLYARFREKFVESDAKEEGGA